MSAAREAIGSGHWADPAAIATRLRSLNLQRVINATGVLLHTNLGRAPWAVETAAEAINLEFDLQTGRRGHRDAAVADKFAVLAGAEAATIVNNGAAAVMLAIAAIAGGSRVAVSRGELVEIGGGFRIPEVMEQSGATLVEVGTTNRTRRSDYQRAVAEQGATMIMLVHRSNFEMTGFTSSVGPAELVDLGVPVVVDLGSGLLDERCGWLDGHPPPWLRGEPGVRQTLDAGADLVLFSADKLLGGPQAGIIAGSSALVERCRRHPLARALRCGGLVLSALDSLADTYLDGRGATVPIWALATTPTEELRARAERIVADVGTGAAEPSEAVMGGGTLAGSTIESFAVVLDGDHGAALRRGPVPVIGRISDDRTILDLRSVMAADDAELTAALRAALAEAHR